MSNDDDDSDEIDVKDALIIQLNSEIDFLKARNQALEHQIKVSSLHHLSADKPMLSVTCYPSNFAIKKRFLEDFFKQQRVLASQEFNYHQNQANEADLFVASLFQPETIEPTKNEEQIQLDDDDDDDEDEEDDDEKKKQNAEVDDSKTVVDSRSNQQEDSDMEEGELTPSTPSSPTSAQTTTNQDGRVCAIHFFDLYCIDHWGQEELRRDLPVDIDGIGVPDYDRVLNVPLPLPDDEELLNASMRKCCWNCSQEDHEVSQCPLPRQPNVIAANRIKFLGANNASSSSGLARYYDREERQALFSHLKVGEYTPELRKALGLADDELPEFVARMRYFGLGPTYAQHNLEIANNMAVSCELLPNTKIEIPGVNCPAPPSTKQLPEFPLSLARHHYEHRLRLFKLQQQQQTPGDNAGLLDNPYGHFAAATPQLSVGSAKQQMEENEIRQQRYRTQQMYQWQQRQMRYGARLALEQQQQQQQAATLKRQAEITEAVEKRRKLQ